MSEVTLIIRLDSNAEGGEGGEHKTLLGWSEQCPNLLLFTKMAKVDDTGHNMSTYVMTVNKDRKVKGSKADR